MFLDLFDGLRREGIPVSPASLLVLMRALDRRLIGSVDELYAGARSILVKSEAHFDAYDRVFLSLYGSGKAADPAALEALAAFFGKPLAEWLRSVLPELSLTEAERASLETLALEELMKLFEERLREQNERHDGGNRFIGTAGTSPFGNAGENPSGIRVGGESRMQSAMKVAGERRFRDYARDRPLARAELGDVFRMLRDLRPEGAKDQLDVEETIRETERQAGEITPIFVRALKDKLEVVLLVDNGGFSMDPYAGLVAQLFREARRAFRRLDVLYFHNTVYDVVWRDARRLSEMPMSELAARDAKTRLLFVGDASMASHELESPYGNVNYWEAQSRSSRDWLVALAERFAHVAWLNPKPRSSWARTRGSYTIQEIGRIVPMFDLSLEGVGAAVDRLRSVRR